MIYLHQNNNYGSINTFFKEHLFTCFKPLPHVRYSVPYGSLKNKNIIRLLESKRRSAIAPAIGTFSNKSIMTHSVAHWQRGGQNPRNSYWVMLQDSSNREPVSNVLFNTRFQTWFPKIHTPYQKWLFDVVLGLQSHERIVDLVHLKSAKSK